MQNTALQQGHQQAAQYVYSSNSYTGQQGAAPSSANSAAYVPQAYTQQSYPQQSYVQQVQVQQPQSAVSQATYGSNTTYGAVGAASQTQSAQPQAVPWSQQASAQTAQTAPQQQSVYGRSTTGVASAASGGGSSGGAAQYGGQYGGVYGTAVQSNTQQVQQVLASTARAVVSPDFTTQGTAGSRGSAAYGAGPDRAINTGASYVVGGTSSVSASGVYGADATKYDDTDKYGTGASSASYDGKNGDYGGASSPSGYSQKAADQYGSNYNIKSSDYSQSDRAQYGQNLSPYGQAESQGGSAARRYHDSQAAIAVAQQRQQQQQQQQQHQQQERQDQQSQLLRQQALQAQQVAAAAILARGATSTLDAATRNQGDYLGGTRAGPARGGGSQDYGGQVRGLLGPSYGGSRSDADAGLLVSQYGGAGGRSTGAVNSIGYGAQQAAMYGALNAGRGLTGQMYAHSAPVIGYGGVQLPPGREYSAGRGTGGGGYIACGSRSDRPSIGSSRFEDRRDDRPPPRRDGGRDDRRGGGGGRDRERDRMRNSNRERETHRDRRDDLRKRERSPLRPVRDHKDLMAGKRDDRGGRKESPRRDFPHRITSPAKEKRRDYLCKIEQFSFVDDERDYTALCKRYPKLYVVPEFAKLAVCWLGKDSQLRLNQPISFEHDAVDVEDEGESKEAPPKSSDKVSPSSAAYSTKGTTTWNSKVMLMSGFSEAALAELLSDNSVEDKPPHLHNLLKFVALRKDRSAIMACGGAWDKDLDGGDPATDEGALLRTAIRCTKQSTQLDLSSCTHWLRFLEVHYERLGEDGLPSHNDVTVIFIPDLSQVLPLLEDWQLRWTQWKQLKFDREASAKGEKEPKPAEKKPDAMEVDGNGTKDVEEILVPVDGETENKDDNKDHVLEDKGDTRSEDVDGKGKTTEVGKDIALKPEEDLPQQPGLLLTTKRTKTTKMRSMTISLDGLLDYDEEDREECTFELSVFAEVYQEMLGYKMGSLILSDLEVLRETVYARKREERKRLRPGGKDEIVEGEGSSSRKRSKFSDTAGTPEPKTEIISSPKADVVPEQNTEIAQLAMIENVADEIIQAFPEPETLTETVATDPLPEIIPEHRLEIEASDILNANSEEDLRKLVAKMEETVSESEKGRVDAVTDKTEENGDGHDDDKKELDGILFSETEGGHGVKDTIVDALEVAVRTGSSDVDMKDAAASKDRGSGDKAEDRKLEKRQHVLNKEVLQAYRYFDRNRVGYLKADDVRRLLHSLGRYLSHRNVKELVACAVAESSKARDERIVYRNFTEKETTTD
ncbi:unnamed protein product [Calypogeia fissa]